MLPFISNISYVDLFFQDFKALYMVLQQRAANILLLTNMSLHSFLVCHSWNCYLLTTATVHVPSQCTCIRVPSQCTCIHAPSQCTMYFNK